MVKAFPLNFGRKPFIVMLLNRPNLYDSEGTSLYTRKIIKAFAIRDSTISMGPRIPRDRRIARHMIPTE